MKSRRSRNFVTSLLALSASLLACGAPASTDSEGTAATAEALTTWGPWTLVPGNHTDVAPASVAFAGRVYTFIKALDGSISSNAFALAGGWRGWRTIGGQTDTSLAATVCYDGIYLVQKGLDGHVYTTSSNDGLAWSGWAEVPGGGQTNAALSATCVGQGTGGLRIYMKGLDGKVYENVRSEGATNIAWVGWSGWHEVGGGWVTDVPIASFESSHGYGGVNLLFKGLNDNIYMNTLSLSGYYTTSGTWGGWQNMGGTTDVALAGTQNMFVAKGINDDTGYYATYNSSTSTWTGQGTVGVGTTNTAYSISGYLGGGSSINFGYYLFAKGINDNGLYLKSTASLTPPVKPPPPPPPPPPPGPITTTATSYMQIQQGSPGDNLPIGWGDEFGIGIAGGTLKGITNPTFNTFNIYLVKAGHYSNECGNPSAIIPLGPGQGTTDMLSLYGVAAPALPTAIVACAGGGPANVPATFPISVTYTHQ